MFILIFYVILFVLQIILFVLAIKDKQKKIWDELFIIEGISLMSPPIYAKIFKAINVGSSWSGLGVAIIGIIVAIPFGIFICISIIARIILRKKIIQTQEKSKLPWLILLIIILFIICTIPDIKPLIDERTRRKEFSNYIMTYLNDRYGNGNYKIEKIYNWNDCGLACLDMGRPNAYEFTIQSDNLDNNFTVKINIETKEIKEDTFLYDYYKKDYSVEVENEIYNEMNNLIPENSGYKVSLEVLINKDSRTNYGKIPTIDEIKEDVKQNADITFKNFIINRDFINEEDFKVFMIDVYKEYLLNYKKYNKRDLIDFVFVNGNPFFEDTMYGYYKDDGYIKEKEDNIYIYNNASPIIIPLNEIFSDK